VERCLRDVPPLERPRERLFLYGGGELTDAECVALVVGNVAARSSLTVARALLDRFGSLRALDRADPYELVEQGTLGFAGAASLKGAFELSRRAALPCLDASRAVRSGSDLYDRYRGAFLALRKETFVAVYLDGRHRVVREERVSEGTLNAALVHPREVLGPALRIGAACFVVMHNHPSGDPTPSAEDLAVTRRLAEAGELVGIPLLDHLILGDDRYCSFLERGSLTRPRAPAGEEGGS
jgi:DNA repair protein RadC